jgi:hypothetical protein
MTRRVKIDIIEEPLPQVQYSSRKWIKVGEKEATFEAWGLGVDEEGSYSVAIVVLDDGRVELVDPKRMQFMPDSVPSKYKVGQSVRVGPHIGTVVEPEHDKAKGWVWVYTSHKGHACAYDPRNVRPL